MTRRSDALAPRKIQTLTGPVLYADSGWTEAEWQLITSAMARCDSPRNTTNTSAKPRRRKPKKTRWHQTQLQLSVARDLAKPTELDKIKTVQADLKAQAAQRRATQHQTGPPAAE